MEQDLDTEVGREGENNMVEIEIKIALVPKEQTNERRDCIRITCGDIIAWGLYVI